MFPAFALPWALFGLAALPTLAAIYWLRNRYRRVPVSSLLLWSWQQQPRAGGPRVQRLQLPLLFFLELVALLLLVLAAADPGLPFAAGRRPLVVVLDDSFSMTAGGDESPRQRAAAALASELRDGPSYAVRCVRAGPAPQVLGDPVYSARDVRRLLEGWHCHCASARIEEALALANQLGGESALILVLSDHAPSFTLADGRMQWWSFGTALPNAAFVAAARTVQGERERCLLEIANFAPQRRDTDLVVKSEAGAVLYRDRLELGAGETRRLLLPLPPETPVISAELQADALGIDNRATLVRDEPGAVRVNVNVADETLRRLLDKALAATGKLALGATRPDLIITDAEAVDSDAWQLRLVIDKEAESFAGPFIIDHAHPLADGLSLGGAVWGGGKESTLPGAPIVLAGNVPLLTDDERPPGRHDIYLRLRPDLSTLQDSPAWPVLLWNLVQWRAAHFPGLARANLRLDDSAMLTVRAGVDTVDVAAPGATPRPLPVHNRRVTLALSEPGLYTFRAGDATYRAAANALSRTESDLSAAVTGRWGRWADQTGTNLSHESFAWILLLAAAAVLTLHLFVAQRSGP
jgi:hypothetical protein